MPKPNFFVAGQGKSGTTFLWTVLRSHPDVFVPDEKETPFFSDETYLYGLPYYERLHHHNYAGQPLIGDCFSANMFGEDVPERIYRCLGSDVKFIFTMRHPVYRAISHYNMAVRQFRETKPFAEAVQLEPQRWSADRLVKRGMSYIGRAYYAKQIENFLRFYPRHQMLFLIYETDYGDNAQATTRRLFEFLGARSDAVLQSPGVVNAAPRLDSLVEINEREVVVEGKRYLDATPEFVERAQRARELMVTTLADGYERALWKVFFEEEIRQLENIIGQDLSIWHERYR